MIIDFHTHYFPDDIAEKTINKLCSMAGVKPHGNGTLISLVESMMRSGITYSVNAPVATKPEQVIGINRKMTEHPQDNGNSGIICLGAMHPLFSRIGDFEEEIAFLKAHHIKGIKLHPEYQQFMPDDGKVKKLYDACVKHDMFILFHAGADCAFDGDDVHGIPSRFAEVIKVRGLKVILAHMGGFRLWDDVYKHLIGKDVYIDTAYSMEMEDISMTNIIKMHGTDKVVFGSDFPWESQAALIEKVKRCVTDETDREKIFYKNAKGLLGL